MEGCEWTNKEGRNRATPWVFIGPQSLTNTNCLALRAFQFVRAAGSCIISILTIFHQQLFVCTQVFGHHCTSITLLLLLEGDGGGRSDLPSLFTSLAEIKGIWAHIIKVMLLPDWGRLASQPFTSNSGTLQHHLQRWAVN